MLAICVAEAERLKKSRELRNLAAAHGRYGVRGVSAMAFCGDLGAFGPLRTAPPAFLTACFARGVLEPIPSALLLLLLPLYAVSQFCSRRRVASPGRRRPFAAALLSAALLAACAAVALATALSNTPAYASTLGPALQLGAAAFAAALLVRRRLGGVGGGELRLVAGYCAVEVATSVVVALQLSAPPRGASFWCAAARAVLALALLAALWRAARRGRRGGAIAVAEQPSPLLQPYPGINALGADELLRPSSHRHLSTPKEQVWHEWLSYSTDTTPLSSARNTRLEPSSAARPSSLHNHSSGEGSLSSLSTSPVASTCALPPPASPAIPWPVDASASTSLLPASVAAGGAAATTPPPPTACRRGRPP